MLELRLRRYALGAAALAGAGALMATNVAAQIPNPPSTVFGSVTDDAGRVPENLRVEAYIGDTLCGEGATGYTGDGDAQVTVWYADVVSSQQEAGCGEPGKEVRIKIGERFADETFRWEAGPVRLDITFGNATPAPIPTPTPSPTRAAQANPTQSGDAPASVQGTAAPGAAGTQGPGSRGGVTNADRGNTNDASVADDGGGGFPVWAVAVLVLGGIAAVGGGVGYAMARSRADDDDDFLPRPPLD